MTITRFSAQTKFETDFGFVRAVRAANLIFVSGCTAMSKGGATTEDVVDQSREALQRIVDAIENLATSSSYVVVRTRFYVTESDEWQRIGAVHREFFSSHLPASTLVEVSKLAHESLKVEVEADALVLDE